MVIVVPTTPAVVLSVTLGMIVYVVVTLKPVVSPSPCRSWPPEMAAGTRKFTLALPVAEDVVLAISLELVVVANQFRLIGSLSP
jgi:hypothetical protein